MIWNKNNKLEKALIKCNKYRKLISADISRENKNKLININLLNLTH